MLIEHKWYTASKNGKTYSLNRMPTELLDGILDIFKQAGYVVSLNDASFEITQEFAVQEMDDN